jgi:esterase
MPLQVEVIGRADAPRVGWFLHGILGRGRNWRSFARRVADAAPDFRLVLPDLRCHGESACPEGPHDLAACADDLKQVAAEHGAPEVVVGHSFGGKVALACLRAGLTPRSTWVLDSPPGVERAIAAIDPRLDPATILRVLKAIPVPAESRDQLRAPLREAGIPEGIVAWLLTSAASGPDGWRFLWDLDGVEELLASYLSDDLWPIVWSAASEVHLVRAGRSDRWRRSWRG